MSLTYLSGDGINTADYIAGKKKKSSGGGGGGGRAAKKSARKAKKSPSQKKAGRKRVFKKVAKVGLAPARAAFLTVVTLNGLKMATKLARVWNRPNGKATLQKFWDKFGGDISKLKAAIIKGTKNRETLNGDSVGAVALTTALATATPIIIAVVPIIKAFKAGGDKKEAAEFNEGVEDGKKDLAEDESVPKAKASMPRNKEVGYSTNKEGESNEDASVPAGKRESESGGSDAAEDESDEKKKGIKSGVTDAKGESSEGGGDEDKKADAERKMSSNFSPLGLFFMSLMYSTLLLNQNIFLVQLLNTYCLLGMLLIPVALTKNPVQRIAQIISYTPINIINSLNTLIKLQWQKN